MPRYPRRSSRTPKASKKSPQRSPSPAEEVIERKLRSKRLRKTKAGDSVVSVEDEGSGCDIIDIIDIIDGAHEDGGRSVEVEVEVADEGVDESDEDRRSVCSSVASGPSVWHDVTLRTPRPLPGECSACRKLYQKAKKMKAPMKSKLLDNNPKSLTCDQWVLIKHWSPRRPPNASGKLLTHVQLVKKRLQAKNGAKRTEQCAEESSACPRPHIFLQRNLRLVRRLVRAPAKREKRKKKRNRRKRARDDSQGPRVAKQQRLHGDSQQHDSPRPASGHSSGAGYEEQEENDSSSDADLTVEIIPAALSLVTAEPSAAAAAVAPAPRRPRTPKRAGGFRDLLAQLRGNSSMIVRETR